MGVNSRFEDRIRAKLEQRIRALSGKTIQAGFFPEAAYADGTPVAYVAAIQEYGSPEAGIPARPFMRSTVAEQKKQWGDDLARGVKAAFRGAIEADDVFEQVGGVMAADIQETIASIETPPLSPITVMLRGMRRNDTGLVVTGATVGEAARRVAAGDTNYGASTKPLVDEGILLASVTHKVES